MAEIKKSHKVFLKCFSNTIQILNQLNVIVAKAQQKDRNSGATKEKVAIQKIFTKIHEHLEPYNEKYMDKCDDIRLKYASVDEKENVLYSEKSQYQMTAENTIKARDAITALGLQEVFFKVLTIETNEVVEYDFLQGFVEFVKPKGGTVKKLTRK